LIAPGGIETSSRGLAAKLQKDGSLSWAYLTSIPCEGLTLDSKQEKALFTLKFPNRGIELHNYNLDNGGKDYIYEYELLDIDTIQDTEYANDFYWIAGYRTTLECFILKLSKTRRFIYMCPANTNIKSMIIPIKDPVVVGYSSANNPYLLKFGESDFTNVYNFEISNILSTSMSIQNRFKGDTQLTWAYASTVEDVYVTSLDIASDTVLWTKKLSQKMTDVVISYTEAFDEYVMVGKYTANSNNCFLRFSADDGSISFLKCTAVNSYTNYMISTSSLHTDFDANIFIGGQLNNENFFYIRTGVELGDASCYFQNSERKRSTEYSSESFKIVSQNLGYSLTSYLSNKINLLF